MTFAKSNAHIKRGQTLFPVGRITRTTATELHVSGLVDHAKLGDRVTILGSPAIPAQVIGLGPDTTTILPDGTADGVTIGHPVRLDPAPVFAPDDSWIGRIVDPDGTPLDGQPLLAGLHPRALDTPPPAAHSRRPFGPRTGTNLAVFDTLLPLVQGQRIGLFAGSGVGKSTLLGDLATGVDADVIVIGLIGERGRELRHFVDHVLGEAGLQRAVIVAATSDMPPQSRRACAWAATAVAEHFRDQGKHVLLLLDSITRFAEAHREVATTSAQAPMSRGYPTTTNALIARLCERAGPGTDGTGDITAVFSVLVAGSDMEEPIADMLRGVLDGHIVLDRQIAERGRFPAVDVVRSVSRSLPDAATSAENTMIQDARRLMAAYDRAELMIQAGLYVAGSDATTDAAVQSRDALERFLTHRKTGSVGASFSLLRQALASAKPRDG